MKVLQVLILVLVFSHLSYAQADCNFSFRLFVRDSKGNSLRKAKIKLRGEVFQYDESSEYYYGGGLFGVGAKYRTLLKVKSKGFERFEKELEIECGYFNYDLTLKPKGSDKEFAFEELAQIQGIVTDKSNAVIPNSKIIITVKNGKEITLFTNEYGFYRIVTKSGEYQLEFIGIEGFAPKKFENYKLEKGYKNLDVVLDVFKNINTIEIDTDKINNKRKNNR